MAIDPMVEAAIYERYPGLRALLGIPEVGDLLVQAVNPTAPFSQQEFERRLHETTWWKTTAAPTRDSMIRGIEDPATERLAQTHLSSSLYDWEREMGVYMDDGTRYWFTGMMNTQGIDVNSPVMQNELRAWLRNNPQNIMDNGTLAGLRDKAFGIAHTDYFIPLDWASANTWAISLGTGEADEATYRAALNRQAAAWYPHLSDWLIQGQTPADIINPLRKVAAEELEVDMNFIDIGQPQWKFLTGVPDAERNQGGFRLPTYSEVQRAARSDSRWWGTAKGQQTDAGLSRTILEAFGKRAF